MSSNDPPTFSTTLFNAKAFTDPNEALTLGDANNLYFKRAGGIVSGLLTIQRPNTNSYLRYTDGTTTVDAFINSGGIPSIGTISNHGLGFYTNNGSSNQFFLATSGNVGIGTSSPSNQLTLSLDSAAKPSTSTWTVSSDERVKEAIEDADLDICYDNIKNLKLKYFKWKDEFIDSHSIEDKHKLGWIAQDVETVLPKAVTTANNEKYGIEDFKSLNSDQIIACMYGAIQKLIEKVESM